MRKTEKKSQRKRKINTNDGLEYSSENYDYNNNRTSESDAASSYKEMYLELRAQHEDMRKELRRMRDDEEDFSKSNNNPPPRFDDGHDPFKMHDKIYCYDSANPSSTQRLLNI
ncbi:hypothetical protein TKK_0019509 [Trichogramma kaykai]